MLLEFAAVPFAAYAPDSGSTPPAPTTAPGSLTGGTYVNEGLTSA